MHNVDYRFKASDWTRWQALFQNTGFEIYETTKEDIKEEDLQEQEQRVRDGEVLDMREVFEDVKNCYCDLLRSLQNCTPEEKRFGGLLFV